MQIILSQIPAFPVSYLVKELREIDIFFLSYLQCFHMPFHACCSEVSLSLSTLLNMACGFHQMNITPPQRATIWTWRFGPSKQLHSPYKGTPVFLAQISIHTVY